MWSEQLVEQVAFRHILPLYSGHQVSFSKSEDHEAFIEIIHATQADTEVYGYMPPLIH